MIDDHGVDALFLVIRPHGDQQQVDGIVFVERLQNIDPAGGEILAPAFLQRAGNGGSRHAHGHHLLPLIHDEEGQIGVDKRGEFGTVSLDLLIRQLHGAVQRRVAGVHQLEKPGDQAEVIQPGFRLEYMQVAALGHKVRQPLPALDDLFVGGHLDQILHPVHVLHIPQPGQVIDVIGVVIIGEEAAAAVEALHQHALPIQIGKAQRAMDLIAALFPGPALHRGKQGVGHLLVINKIHLREPHPVGVPFLIGLVAEDGADAAHHLAVAHGQPAAGLAVFKGRVFLFVPVAHIVVKSGGHKLGHVFI